MAFNGAGVFSRLYNWVNDRDSSIKIQAARMDAEMDGFATGLSTCITKDGQTTITADIPLNNHKLTGLATPTNNGDAATKAYVDGEIDDVAGDLEDNGTGRILIEEKTASSSGTIDFTTGLDDTYDRYEIELISVKPASDDVYLGLRVGTGAGPTWQAGSTAYTWGSTVVGPGGSTGRGSTLTGPTTLIALTDSNGTGAGVGNATGESLSGLLRFMNPEVSDVPLFNFSIVCVRSDGFALGIDGGGAYGSNTPVTGVRFLFSSGNIASGTFRLWGYRKD